MRGCKHRLHLGERGGKIALKDGKEEEEEKKNIDKRGVRQTEEGKEMVAEEERKEGTEGKQEVVVA